MSVSYVTTYLVSVCHNVKHTCLRSYDTEIHFDGKIFLIKVKKNTNSKANILYQDDLQDDYKAKTWNYRNVQLYAKLVISPALVLYFVQH